MILYHGSTVLVEKPEIRKGETFLVNAPAGSYEMLILDVTREG